MSLAEEEAALEGQQREAEAELKALEDETVDQFVNTSKFRELSVMDSATLEKLLGTKKKTLKVVVKSTDLTKIERLVEVIDKLIPLVKKKETIASQQQGLRGVLPTRGVHYVQSVHSVQPHPQQSLQRHNLPSSTKQHPPAAQQQGDWQRGGQLERAKAPRALQHRPPQQRAPPGGQKPTAVQQLQSGRDKDKNKNKPLSQVYPGVQSGGTSRAQGAPPHRSGTEQLAPAPARSSEPFAQHASADPFVRVPIVRKSMCLGKKKIAVASTSSPFKPPRLKIAAEAPPPKVPSRKAKKADPIIELLESDEEEEPEVDGGGLADPYVAVAAGRASGSARPTRSTVKLCITKRIGSISAIYPPAAPAALSGGVDQVAATDTATGVGTGAGAKARVMTAAAAGAAGAARDGSGSSGAAGTSMALTGASKTPDTVEVSSRDLLTLEDGEFLNDTVVDFFIKKLQHEDMKQEDAARCHIFNSFFFEKLTNENKEKEADDPFEERQKTAHVRVQKWTRGINIFDKDFVFFPIHSQLHWSVVVLCHPGAIGKEEDMNGEFVPIAQRPGPYLLHLDSMAGGHRTQFVVKKLREYLACEWQRLNPHRVDVATTAVAEKNGTKLLQFAKTTLPSLRLKIPQQDNGCDCGLFLLSFMQRFISPAVPAQLSAAAIIAAFRGDAPPEGSLLPVGFLRNDWFVTEEAALQRVHITELILTQLYNAQPDPELARRANAAEATVAKYEQQRQNIEIVLDEVRERVADRKRTVFTAEKRMVDRRSKEAARKARVAERSAAANMDDNGAGADAAANPTLFYGPATGNGATARRKTSLGNDKGGEVDDKAGAGASDPRQFYGSAGKGAARLKAHAHEVKGWGRGKGSLGDCPYSSNNNKRAVRTAASREEEDEELMLTSEEDKEEVAGVEEVSLEREEGEEVMKDVDEMDELDLQEEGAEQLNSSDLEVGDGEPTAVEESTADEVEEDSGEEEGSAREKVRSECKFEGEKPSSEQPPPHLVSAANALQQAEKKKKGKAHETATRIETGGRGETAAKRRHEGGTGGTGGKRRRDEAIVVSVRTQGVGATAAWPGSGSPVASMTGVCAYTGSPDKVDPSLRNQPQERSSWNTFLSG
jgi:hypothetical protein